MFLSWLLTLVQQAKVLRAAQSVPNATGLPSTASSAFGEPSAGIFLKVRRRHSVLHILLLPGDISTVRPLSLSDYERD
jgi:hypothetical protein